MGRLALILCACTLLPACYRSHGRTAGSAGECGNGLVEPGEECDGGVGPCLGLEHCTGVRTCGGDCTWGECSAAGFGVLSGPVDLTMGLDLMAVQRTSTSWTGRRFGVHYSGTGAEPSPTIRAWFTGVDRGSVIDVDRHEVIPATGSNEIDASWRPSDSRFGIVMSRPMTEYLLFNLADESGWVLIDPGVTTTTGEITDPVIASGAGSFGAAWRDVGTQRIVFGALTPDMGIVATATIDEHSPMPYHRLPRIAAFETGFALLWQVDDPSVGESYLGFARLDNDSDLMGGIKALFADLEPTPPADIVDADPVFGVVFATQPYFDSPVLDLHLASVDAEGVTVLEPVDAARVRRPENHDAALGWSGEEYAVVSAVPGAEEPDADRSLLVQRFGPDGSAYSTLAVPIPAGDVSKPSLAWDGEAYGVSYAVERGGALRVEFIRLGCIPPD